MLSFSSAECVFVVTHATCHRTHIHHICDLTQKEKKTFAISKFIFFARTDATRTTEKLWPRGPRGARARRARGARRLGARTLSSRRARSGAARSCARPSRAGRSPPSGGVDRAPPRAPPPPPRCRPSHFSTDLLPQWINLHLNYYSRCHACQLCSHWHPEATRSRHACRHLDSRAPSTGISPSQLEETQLGAATFSFFTRASMILPDSIMIDMCPCPSMMMSSEPLIILWCISAIKQPVSSGFPL